MSLPILGDWMPRAGLTAASIVEAAIVIADREGLAAVTFAGLAGRLGVRPPSLYKHLDSLDALLRALSLRGLIEANARLQRATVGRSRETALFAIADAYWQFARDRPGLYAASLRPARAGERDIAAANDHLLGTVVAVLAGYGIAGTDTLHATRGLRALIHGFVSLNASGGFRLGHDLEESFRRLLAAFARDIAERGAPERAFRPP